MTPTLIEPSKFYGRHPWAKTSSRTSDSIGLPLYVHLADVVGVVDVVLDRWVPPGTYDRLSDSLGHDLRDVVAVCAAAHDIGKASPFFQHLVPHLSDGLPDEGLADTYVPHTTISAKALGDVLRSAGAGRSTRRGFETVVAGHHGRFPTESGFPTVTKLESPDWQEHRVEVLRSVLNYVGIDDLAGFSNVKWEPWTISAVTGLVIVSDWIGSNSELFPVVSSLDDHPTRLKSALDRLNLGSTWTPSSDPISGWQERFNLAPDTPLNPMQQAVVDNAGDGLTIIEYDTGGGKTAAALIAAEKIAHQQDRQGIYLALPTRTVANAMYDTVTRWLSYRPSPDEGQVTTSLLHAKADRVSTFRQVKDGHIEGVDYHAWYRRKKALLSPVAVGTIDNVLAAGLKSPHVSLRHVGVMSKVVVIDEVHSSDPYMETYLRALLEWCGALGVPVIALSATLSDRRRELVTNAYLSGSGKEPAGTLKTLSTGQLTRVTAGGDVSVLHLPTDPAGRKSVNIELADGDPDLAAISEVVARGGVIGLVADTVSRSQMWYVALREILVGTDVELVLLHSRFTTGDRTRREQDVVSRCGRGSTTRPEKMIVVATQVIEQSLDIDFDYMVTDLAPADVLLQRLGRLHRHPSTTRPPGLVSPEVSVCGVSGTTISKGIGSVYPKYLLYRTLQWLRRRATVSLPDDVKPMMDSAFNDDLEHLSFDSDIALVIEDERAAYDSLIDRDHAHSSRTVLPGPRESLSSLSRWSLSSTSADEFAGGVRSPSGSIEVELVLPDQTDTLTIPRWLYTDARVEELTDSRGVTRVVTSDTGHFDLGRVLLRYDRELGLIAEPR